MEGTKCLIEASMKAGAKVLVYTSSSSVIKREPSMSLANADETWSVITGRAQKDPYLRSKVGFATTYLMFHYTVLTQAEAETLVLAANRKNTQLTCALCGAAIFGERDKTVMLGFVNCYNTRKTGMQISDNSN